MSSPDDQRPDNADADHLGIDDLLELEPYYHQFENEWNNAPFPDLKQFIGQLPERHRKHALAELIQLDLERRWSTTARHPSADPLPARPHVEDYWSAFSEYHRDAAVSLELIAAEFQVRGRWGDQPDISEFINRFPEHRDDLRARFGTNGDDDAVSKSSSGHDEASESPQLHDRPESRKNFAKANDVSGEQSADESFRSLKSGMEIDDYVLQLELGRGSSGVVFRAERRDQPGRFHAMKLIRPDRISDPIMLRRFQQEIQVLTKLPPHPNVVSLVDSGEWQGVAWTVMEFIEGIRLDKLPSACSQLSIPDACEILRQTAVGLELIHDNQVTHRDLKPDNLILSSDGSVRILDLGMARLMQTDSAGERLTPTGTAMGTPGYMAPEQWRDAKRVDARADIYSMGCTMYFLLAGEPPFNRKGKNRVLELMDAHAQAEVPDLSRKRSDSTPQLQEIIEFCMAKRPEDRPQSARELQKLLQPFCDQADLASLLDQCSNHPEFGAQALTDVSDVDSGKSATTLFQVRHLPQPGAPTAQPAEEIQDVSESESNRHADEELPEDVDASVLDTLDPPEPGEPNLEETLIRQKKELEATHSESTFKPSPDLPPSQQGSAGRRSGGPAVSSSGLSSGVSSISLRRRDISFGDTQSGQAAEYQIGPMLGAGGMGAVYKARQSSIDRIVALKTIKSDRASPEACDSFLAEAIITGALEHPNIVPIHDLGANEQDDPFYAMKEVRGDSWRKTIDQLSLDQNIEILLKVADAIAFSHSKGIVHRDLKPDNVMIGEFGEVLVMDWGLALPTPEFEKTGLPAPSGIAGTPAYMAPEMARGPWKLVGPASDIYLLGAILFRFTTGRNAHTGENALVALKAASDNIVKWPAEDEDVDHELVEIARIAMATRPEDRYASVLEFQSALLEYRSHRESRHLTESALNELQAASQSSDYRGYERAVASLEEALKLWESNRSAKDSLQKARLQYASTALERGDFDLAESQLDPADETHQPLLDQLHQARADRAAQLQRLKRWRRMAAGLVAAVVVIVTVSAIVINVARVNEANAKSEAVDRFIESQSAINELAGLADALKDYPLATKERQELLEAVAGYYERQASDVSQYPQLQIEQLRSLVRLGEIQNQMGDYEKAVDIWDQADSFASKLTGRKDLPKFAPILFAEIQIGLSRSLSAMGNLDESITAATDAIEQLEEHFSEVVSNDARQSLASALLNRADISKRNSRMQVVETDLNQAIAHFDELPDPERLVGKASAQSLLSQVFQARGEYDQARQNVEEAIALWNTLAGQSPEKIDYTEGLAISLIDRANVLRSSGHDPLNAYADAVVRLDDLVFARPLNHRYRFNLATAVTGLAWSQNRRNLTGEAMKSAGIAIDEFDELNFENPEDRRYLYGLMSAGLVMAEVLKDRGETDEALESLLGLDELLSSGEVDPEATETLELLGQVLLIQGMTESVADQTDAARNSLTQAAGLFARLIDSPTGLPRHRDLHSWALFHLSHAAAKSGDDSGSDSAYRQALEIREPLPEEARWLDSHAWFLLYPPADFATTEPVVAEAAAKASLAVQRVSGNARFHRTLALAKLRTGDLSEAESVLAEAARIDSTDQTQHPELLFLQAMLKAKQNQPDEARAFLKSAESAMDEFSPGNSRQRFLRSEARKLLEEK